MKAITIYSKGLKPFEAEFNTAIMMLAVMINENRETRFWFGSSNGSVSGEMSLYINGDDYCKTLSEYPDLNINDLFNESFHVLDDERKAEIKAKHLEEHVSPHEFFMHEIGNELKLNI